MRQGADLVLVLGGDGTVNEVVQGLVDSNVPLGVLPGGTANVLAMELGLGSRLETRCRAGWPRSNPVPWLSAGSRAASARAIFC